jgi:SAM-dependent methyltransferase
MVMTTARGTDDAVRLHEEQAALFRDRYESYQRDPYQSAFTYGRKHVEAMIKAALRRLSPGARLCDAGCGTGFLMRELSGLGFRCAGIDMAWGMLLFTRETAPQSPVVYGDVRALPFATGSFDALVSVEVLRYLPDPDRALAEYRRLLAPGGVCVATVAPRFSTHGYALFNWLTTRRQGNVGSARQYFETTRSIARRMRRAGFTDVSVRACFLGPFRVFEHVAPRLVPSALRRWETIDTRVSDLPGVRELANHFVAIGRVPDRSP